MSVANDYRHEYQHGCGLCKLVAIIIIIIMIILTRALLRLERKRGGEGGSE